MNHPRSTPAALAGTVLLAALVAFAAACEPPHGPDAGTRPPSHGEYLESLANSPLAATLSGQRWLEAAADAVAAPSLLELPHYEHGAFLPYEARSIGIAFDATDDQRLRIDLDVSEDSEGRLFADLYFVDTRGDSRRLRDVASLTDLEGAVIPLARPGRYLLRLQPELMARIDYRLRIELEAAIAFPVSGRDHRDIGGIFGDPRDGGARRHEGIDIFAPRSTPVVAVADGMASPRRTRLGGTTVWLRSDDASFYYAHLDALAIDGRTRVRAGETIGFVGNSGNASMTPPHLHFGIYRRGHGPVDPLPYLVDRVFTSEPETPAYAPAFVRVTASALNLRPLPGTGGAAIAKLPKDAVVRLLGAAGDWLRVRTADGQTGWIHQDFQVRMSRSGSRYAVDADVWLASDPVVGRPAVARIRRGTPVHVFADAAGWQLVGITPDEPVGWLAPPDDLVARDG